MPANTGRTLRTPKTRKAQTAVFALGEVEIRSEHLHLPAFTHKTCCHFKLTGMPRQIGGIGKLIDQPEAGHNSDDDKEAAERGSVKRSW